MKKIFLAFTITLISISFAAAQTQEGELTTRKGTPILPKAGSMALGVDAKPFFDYVGGIFSDSHAKSPSFGFKDGLTLYGKYFLSDKTALRAKVRLGYDSNSNTNLEHKANSSNADEMVENVTTVSNMNISLSAGLEKRIGKTRLQGFYGAEVGLGLASANNTKSTYGNALSAANPYFNLPRTLSEHGGTTFSLGAGAFAGVEYFVAPGIAIGGEVGWGIGFSATGRGSEETERWTGSAVKTEKTEIGGKSSFAFDNAGVGSINLTFYF